MKITFIHHSAFLVELEEAYLLFDYTEGIIPPLEEGKPLAVFVSHRHGDHYSQKIFELADTHPGTRFVLSHDIWRRRLPHRVLEITDSIRPGEVLAVCAGSVPMTVKAYRSTDEGVAFLIRCGGKSIYHAGDLNNWTWSGEPDSWNKNMASKYRGQLELMEGLRVDAAFLPLDPRQEENFYLGMDEFLSKVEAAAVFPMHCWGDFSVIGRLKSMECSKAYRGRIVDIHRDGEVFAVGE